jgi:hypothetical protein
VKHKERPRVAKKTRGQDPRPAQRSSSCTKCKRLHDKPSSKVLEAARAARNVLLGPVVGDLGYDLELTHRYQQATEIVNRWPGLGHRERIALNSHLPWTETVHLVWASTRRVVDREAG